MHSDKVLVKRLLPEANHDPADRVAAWNEWYERVSAASALAFVRTKNDTAEPGMDILQEAMMIAYVEVERGRHEPRPGVPLTAYVKGIARSKIREARRQRRRWLPLEEVAEWRLANAAGDMETRLERRERAALLRACLTRLPQARSQVLERYLRGQTTAEIAHALHMSEASVRQHKSRASALRDEHAGQPGLGSGRDPPARTRARAFEQECGGQ